MLGVTLENTRCYQAYGLLIKSDFDLSLVGLRPLKLNRSSSAMLRIKKEEGLRVKNREYLDDETSVSKSFGYYFKKGIGLFEFILGKQITVFPDADEPSVDFIRTLLNYPVACILYQRGFFSLHASAVHFGGKVYIFPGKSMSGKSSIAAYIIKNGGKLITEDTAVIDVHNGRIKVRSSYPFIKLSSEANNELSFSSDSGLQLPCDKNSRLGYLLKKTNFQTDSVYVDYCIFLEFSDVTCIDSIKSVELSQNLLRASLNIYPLTPEKHVTLFRWNNTFSKSVKGLCFRRRKTFSSNKVLLNFLKSL